MPEVPPLLASYSGRREAGAAAAAASGGGSGEVRAVTLEAILQVVKATAGAEADADAPLMESGLDSLGAVELGNQLRSMSGAALPSTLVFDYPTARQLAGYLEEQAEDAAEGGRAEGGPAAQAAVRSGGHAWALSLAASLPSGIATPSQLRHLAAAAATALVRCRRSGGRWRLRWLAWSRSSAGECGTAAS